MVLPLPPHPAHKTNDQPPQEVVQNFTRSSTQDRLRIVGTFAAVACVLLLFPVLLCRRLDGADIPWTVVFAPLLLLELLWTALQLAGFRAIRRTRGTSASSSSSSSSSTSTSTSTSSSSASSPSASSSVGGGSPAGSSASFGATAATDAPSSPSYFSSSADPNESSSFAIDDDDMDLEFDEDAKPKNAADEAARAVAESVALAGVVNTTLSICWQLLLALKLQSPSGAGYSYDAALLPLLAAEALGVRHNCGLLRSDPFGGGKVGGFGDGDDDDDDDDDDDEADDVEGGGGGGGSGSDAAAQRRAAARRAQRTVRQGLRSGARQAVVSAQEWASVFVMRRDAA